MQRFVSSRKNVKYFLGILSISIFVTFFYTVFPPTKSILAQSTQGFYGKQLSFIKLYGQRNFQESAYGDVTASQMHHAAGLAIDTSGTQPRVYVVDAGNNRILGFSSLTGMAPAASLVLGQVTFQGSACNWDNNTGYFGTVNERTLCLAPFPAGTNIEEYSMRISIDVDADGNVYVPDLWNNRVLRYNQPFSPSTANGAGDSVADFVWGQPDFISNKVNITGDPDTVSAQSLFLGKRDGFDHVSLRGVSVDSQGNVWIADSYNFRVLRFPPGSKTADLVIGQPNFSNLPSLGTAYAACQSDPLTRSLNTICAPTLARVDPQTGKLYVLDESAPGFITRILVYSPPFTNGMSADRILIPQQTGTFVNWPEPYVFRANGFIFNTYKQGIYSQGLMWINERDARRTILIDDQGTILKVVGAPDGNTRGCEYDRYRVCGGDIFQNYNLCWQGGSPGIAMTGSGGSPQLFLADEHFHRIARIDLPYNTSIFNGASCVPQPTQGLMPGIIPNTISPQLINGSSVGLVVAGNQLIVKDRERYMIWNDYLANTTSSPVILGQSTGDAWIPKDMGSRSQHAVDDHNRMWYVGPRGSIRVYQLPLSASSIPIAQVDTLYWADAPSQAVQTNTFESAIAFDPFNKAIWLTDHVNNRVLRISNYNAVATGGSLLVDAVLGQPNKQSVLCNVTQESGWIAPGPPTARSLCNPQFLEFDRSGNFYIVENTYECHGNNRIIMYEASDIASISSMFPMTAAKKVFVRSSLTEQASCNQSTVNAPYSPVSIAFDSNNHMIVGNDGYYSDEKDRAWRQLWYYCNPIKRDATGAYIQGQVPDAYVHLPMGSSGEIAFDQYDNLIVQDHSWARVWAVNYYKDPSLLVAVNNSTCVENISITPTPACSGLVGDIDCSGEVNLLDLSRLLAAYGTFSTHADLDKSGEVNILDLSLLLANYGKRV